MHPILQSRLRLRLYLVGWMFVGVLIALLLVITNGRSLVQALMFTLPLTIIYGFACLSTWWICGANPLPTTSIARLSTVFLAAAVVESALWALVGGLWSGLEMRPMPMFGTFGTWSPVAAPASIGALPESTRRLVDVLVLFALGVPLYLFSAMGHYLLMAFEHSRAAERRALEAQVTA